MITEATYIECYGYYQFIQYSSKNPFVSWMNVTELALKALTSFIGKNKHKWYYYIWCEWLGTIM